MAGGNRRASRASSSRSSGNGQDSPAPSARTRYSYTVVRAEPVPSATSRIFSPAALSRRTSRIFLMVSLFLGKWPSFSYMGVTSQEGHLSLLGGPGRRPALEAQVRCPLSAGTLSG